MFPCCNLEVRYAGVGLELIQIHNSVFTLLFFVTYSTYFLAIVTTGTFKIMLNSSLKNISHNGQYSKKAKEIGWMTLKCVTIAMIFVPVSFRSSSHEINSLVGEE